MQPQTYYSPTSKPVSYTVASKHNHHNSLGGHQNAIGSGSPRSNFQLYRIDERPTSHNYSNQFSNKQQTNLSNSQLKYFQAENFSKTAKANNEKTIIPSKQQVTVSRFGEMKTSYMGPDARENAYMKQISNENARTPKRTPKFSDLGIYPEQEEYQSNQFAKAQQGGKDLQKNWNKKRANDLLNEKSSLQSTASSKKLDPLDRAKMRKSSYQFTQSWLKPINKKKKWLLNDFQKIKQLGCGKYGRVFLVKEKVSQFVCALKIIQKKMLVDEEITEQFIRQLKIQMFLNHPNIIKMYGYFEDQINIYIIMEVALGGQLYKQLKKGNPLPQTKIAMIMKQVVAAVSQLHSNHIIHRDIKPENIVLTENIIKLCDFGWSVYHGQSLRSTFCGTPLYVSPEILKGNNYDQKIDIWSLGIMMYEMLTGENPFKITQQEQLIKIIKDSVIFPSYINVSDQAKDFVMCCLQKNPEDRKNIRQLMNHEFLRKFGEKSPDRKIGI